jgi:hypothetical protein
MIDVTPDDVLLTPSRERVQPRIDVLQPGDARLSGDDVLLGKAKLISPQIDALATVNVRGTPGDDVSLWRFGFIQLKFVTEAWAHYRGEAATQGSVFLAMDRPPARLKQLCRDCIRGAAPGRSFPFYYADGTPTIGLLSVRMTAVLPAGTRIPSQGVLPLSLRFRDSPDNSFSLSRFNGKNNQINNLYSLQYAGAYVTMFAIQKGSHGPIIVLRSFQWNVRWRAHFGLDRVRNRVQLPPRRGDVMEMNISHVVTGAPNDARFRRAILDSSLPICNDLLDHARAAPVIHESIKWEDWNVLH